jgi:hypothetical protein
MKNLKSSSFILDNEISVEEFINKARELQGSKLYGKAKYNLDLVMKYPHTEFKNKILAFAIRSFVDAKVGNINELRIVANKLLTKHFKTLSSSIESGEAEIELQNIKILYRVANEESTQTIEETTTSEINYLYTLLLFKANLIAKRSVNKQSTEILAEEVNRKYMESLEKVSTQLKEKHSILKGDSFYIIKNSQEDTNESIRIHKIEDLARRIKNYINYGELDDEIQENVDQQIEDTKTFFVVSSKWLSDFLAFSEKFCSNPENNILFDRRFVLKQFFANCLDQNSDDCLGSYPGPINNYHLIHFLKTFSNNNLLTLPCELICKKGREDKVIMQNYDEIIFTKESIREKVDFNFIPKSLYLELKSIFSSIFDIPRFESEDKLIELRLYRFKIFVFSNNNERDIISELSVPRYAQFSKSRTFKDLKAIFSNKIFQEIKHILKENSDKELLSNIESKLNLSEEIIFEKMKIYALDAKKKEERKKEIFSLLLAYKTGIQSYKFEGRKIELSNDELIEVSIYYKVF